MSFDSSKLEKKAANYTAAWCSKSPEAVAAHYSDDEQIVINRGDVLKGSEAIAEMAAGFYAEFPDLVVHFDEIRFAGNHAIYVWTLEGHHAETKNYVKVGGWEEWEIDENMKIKSSLGWFDADEYDRQVGERT